MADENEFQVRVSFFADLPPADRLRIIGVRRDIVQGRIGHLDSLRPDAQAEPWGLRVLDFSRDAAQHELRWLDELAVVAAGRAP
jgi:hypothetical protein